LAYDDATDLWKNIDIPPSAGVVTSSTPPTETSSIWFNTENGTTYIYYDNYWTSISGDSGAPIISDTAPASPVVGMQWFNSSNGKSYIYYSNAWVELDSNGTATAPTGNVIINGGMDITQRGTSFTFGSGSGAKFFGADRFQSIDFSWSAGSNITVANDTSVFPSNVGVSASYRVSTGATGLTFNSGGIQYIKTFIEGFDAESLYGRTATLSFYVRSSVVGVYNLFLENGNWEVGTTTRAFSPTYTVNAANTWERKTIVLDMAAATSAGTWNTTNGIGLGISWMLGANANRTGSSYNSGWTTYSAATPQSDLATQFMTGSNRNFYLAGVQLELGTIATPFRRNAPSIHAELAACQRYYQRYIGGVGMGLTGIANSSTSLIMNFSLPVLMRAVPALSGSGNIWISDQYVTDTQTASVTVSFLQGANTSGGRMTLSNFSGLTTGRYYSTPATNSGSGFIEFSAEL
jgi:hypothetical protein